MKKSLIFILVSVIMLISYPDRAFSQDHFKMKITKEKSSEIKYLEIRIAIGNVKMYGKYSLTSETVPVRLVTLGANIVADYRTFINDFKSAPLYIFKEETNSEFGFLQAI